MTIGLVGRKLGMTRVFTPEGAGVPVTVVQVERNTVTQIKTVEKDGYSAIQIVAGTKKPGRVNKPEAGLFAKAGIEAGKSLHEFRLSEEELANFSVGTDLTVEVFQDTQKVDVTGSSKGKGFAGGVKRWNFSMQDATHGNSLSHRAPGSIGQNQTPGRVFKGKKMAGHMGAAQVTVQSLEVVRVDAQKGLLLIKGAVPGATNGSVVVKPAVKA